MAAFMPASAATIVGGNWVVASVPGLDDLVRKYEAGSVSAGLFTIAALSTVVKDFAKRTQAQAVLNVSGVEVTYNGTTFIVNRITGKLSQSIAVLQLNPLAAIVKANAEYADTIETGVDHPVDMKPFLMGKTIPIRTRGMGDAHLAQTSVAGAAEWALPTQGPVRRGVARKKRKHSKGRTSKIEFIAFRKVTANSRGWIMPVRPPRPFMAAAAATIEKPFGEAIEAAYAKYLEKPT